MFESFRAKMKKITMFAIGIGNHVNRRELAGIASRPSEEFTFQVEGYSALDAIKKSLAIKTCRGKSH